MLTVGIDFAAQPANTAIACIVWEPGRAIVQSLTKPADDATILHRIDGAEAVGIDVPFGWPDAFVRFVTQHQADAQSIADRDADAWRRDLAYRLTDRMVAQQLRKQPLSVATDRIGLAAMRASSLLAAIRDAGEPVDRAGGTRITEVYPAGALKAWGLPFSGYKAGNAANRIALVERLRGAAPWLELGAFDAQVRADDDALDAVIASLVARAHALGHWTPPTDEQAAQASREGWMIIPTCGLEDLLARTVGRRQPGDEALGTASRPESPLSGLN